MLERAVVLEPERYHFNFLPLAIFNCVTLRKISDLSENYYYYSLKMRIMIIVFSEQYNRPGTALL